MVPVLSAKALEQAKQIEQAIEQRFLEIQSEQMR